MIAINKQLLKKYLLKLWMYISRSYVHWPLLFILGFIIFFPKTGSIATAVTVPVIALLYFRVPIGFWLIFVASLSWLYGEYHYSSEDVVWPEGLEHFWLISMFALGLFALNLIRPYFVSLPLIKILKSMGFIPRISPTEREALDSGSVWMEREFFKGSPNFRKIFRQPYPKLKKRELDFINNETSKLCSMADEWETIKNKQISPEIHEYIKKEKFLGMIIPEKYQGLDFSPLAHARVIQKVSSINVPVGIFMMVPNSLGPAELLLKYGTQKQKDKYLKNLATGQDIPCFGLTEPYAGSDASSISSEGVLFKDTDGRIKIKINWNKRWISLSSIATVLGLAFQLKDPDHLLGSQTDIGITCALIPGDAPGVKRDLYHDPMGIPFYNAPMYGTDVVVDAETSIIGGLKQAGKGWKMLMECLSVGRGISLPSLSVGVSQRMVRILSCHSSVRRQFGVSIAKFEGVQEALARITGFTHLITATQNFTLSALNQGVDAAITTAITKYTTTEFARKISLDAMDVMAGTGISLGPKNFVANIYKSLPIGITVEGANILTRSLIIYGQGAMRAHPYAYTEIRALEQGDFMAFDRVFWKHLYQIVCNTIRLAIFSLFRGYTHISPFFLGRGHRYLQKIAWSSILFSWLTNIALFIFGAKLKLKEQLTGRFADMLAYQYMAIALLWDWRCKGKSKKTWPVVKWSLDYCCYKIQKSVEGILLNFDSPILAFPARTLIYFVLRLNSIGSYPSDKLSKKLVESLLNDPEFRNNLIQDSYLPEDPEHHLQKLEQAHKLVKKSEEIVKKIKLHVKQGKLPKKRVRFLVDLAHEQGIITQEERSLMQASEKARWDVLQVDTFTKEEYFSS